MKSCNARSPLVSSVLSLTVNNLTYSLGMSLGRSHSAGSARASLSGALGLVGERCLVRSVHRLHTTREVLRERDA